MTLREARQREGLLAELRGLHRRERAPAALRQRVVERFVAEPRGLPRRPTWLGSAWVRTMLASLRSVGPSRSASFAAAALVIAGSLGVVLVPRLLASSIRPRIGGSSGDPALLSVGPEPSGESRRAPGSARSATAAGAQGWKEGSAPGEHGAREPKLARHLQCPLFEVPSGAMIAASKMDRDSQPGLALHTLDMDTFSCGPISRRYLELVPRGVEARSRAPVLIVLHDTGRSAEWTRRDTHSGFDDLARREGLILVYANAAPGSATSTQIGNSGSWQGHPSTHPEVDDEEYLQRIVSDLVVRHVIDGDNDVYLAGLGGGARLALMAAAHQPRAYVGVAAFTPGEAQTIEPPTLAEPARLARVFFVLDARSSLDVTVRSLTRRWAQALGISSEPRQRFWRGATGAAPTTTTLQVDAATPASGSAALRLLVVDGPVDPFPIAAAGDRPAPGSEPSRPRALDGARDAWAFLSGAENAEPITAEALAAEALAAEASAARGLTLDGVSVTSDDVTDFADPPMVFDGDVVKAPPAARP